MKKILTILTTVAVAMALVPPMASAADFPDKPVRFIVPFAPGGATDVVARLLGSKLRDIWKQQVIVENRPGAGGNIGAANVVSSPADGYTILIASPAEVAINRHLYKKMAFDPTKDLQPVTKLATSPLVLVVHPKIPAKTVPELIKYIQAQKGGLNYASSGSGGPQHLAGEQFKLITKTAITHIPYKGGAAATADLLGGQVDMFFSGLPPALPQIKTGKIRALAVTTAKRSALIPDLPSLVEAGVPGFDIENWQGLFVPAGTPKEIVEKLYRDIAAVASQKDFIDALTAQGATPATMPPAQFAEFIRAEDKKYAQLVKESSVTLD